MGETILSCSLNLKGPYTLHGCNKERMGFAQLLKISNDSDPD